MKATPPLEFSSPSSEVGGGGTVPVVGSGVPGLSGPVEASGGEYV